MTRITLAGSSVAPAYQRLSAAHNLNMITPSGE